MIQTKEIVIGAIMSGLASVFVPVHAALISYELTYTPRDFLDHTFIDATVFFDDSKIPDMGVALVATEMINITVSRVADGHSLGGSGSIDTDSTAAVVFPAGQNRNFTPILGQFSAGVFLGDLQGEQPNLTVPDIYSVAFGNDSFGLAARARFFVGTYLDDSILQSVSGPSSIPVPPAILFLGSGIAALRFRRKAR